ncbi:MAG TPA: hypothetical protein PK228_01435 [Saprospiraceae bacterium]|nr:hypothetical protein [Saprospiraceae bacterium]
MLPIFKKASGSPSATDKVGDYNFKDFYPDTNRNMLWSELNPYVRQATRRFILPFVGRDLYDDIADMIEDDDVMTAEQTEFTERLRDAVAYCAIMTALPKKKTVVASMGAVENIAKEGTTGSSLWSFRTTLWSVAQDADRCVDELLDYLEARVKAGDVYFDLWKDSEAFTIGKADLFRTTADFQVFQNINNSRRTYLAMLPILKQATKTHLIPILGQEQYDELVEGLQANDLSAEELLLLDMVRAALAAWAVYYATQKLPVLPDQDGFRVISNADAIDQRAYSAEVTQSAIERIRAGAEQDARTNTADLQAFLAANADDYTTWKDSAANPANNADYYVTPFGGEHGAVML